MTAHDRDRSQHLLIVLTLCGVAVAALIVVALVVWKPGGERAQADGLRGNRLPAQLTSKQAPRIQLRDERGEMVDTNELKGKPYAVTFLFTRCPDVCPLIGHELREALIRVGPGGREIPVLAVSVDPAGDTPDAVRAWRERHHLPPNFRYLIGTKKELLPVWRSYFAEPQLPGRPQTSTHTASIWLVDSMGRIRTSFSAGAAVPIDDLAHDMKLLSDERAQKAGAKEREK